MKLQQKILIAYGLPGLPLAALGLPLYVFLPSFYAENLGLGVTLVGLFLVYWILSRPVVKNYFWVKTLQPRNVQSEATSGEMND